MRTSLQREKCEVITSEDCIFCKLKLKRYLRLVMGPLSNLQLSILPVFYITLVDLWRPLKARYNRETKLTKYHDVYFMVLPCCPTRTVNVQLLEGENT